MMKGPHIFTSLSLLPAEPLSLERPAMALDMLTDYAVGARGIVKY